MHDLALLIPTRGRPGNIRKVISAWDFTGAWDHADMILVVDADDPEIEGYHEALHDLPDLLGRQFANLVIMDEWMPMVHKLDKVADLFAQTKAYFALGFAGDDHIPQTIGWAETYLAQLRELGTGLVYSDDGYQGRNLCSEWAMTADVVRALGRMVPAPVEHMYSDVSLLDLMDAAGAARHLPQVRIEHMHPIVNKAPDDEQYQRVNSREQFRRDEIIYNAWTRTSKAAEANVVRALRTGRADEPQARARPRAARPVRSPQIQRSGPTRRKAAAVMAPVSYPFTREFKHVRGATPDEIGMALADFATQVPADQEIVELGVFQGRTALIMAWGARQGNGAHVTGIDAWDLPGNTYGPPFNEDGSRAWAEYRIRELGYADQITLVKGFASDAADTWPTLTKDGRSIGLLFVDDDHSYAGARRAIEDWAPHLAPDAVIAIDDYGHPDWPGVKEAVDDLVKEGFLEPSTTYHDRLAVTKLADAERVHSQRGLATYEAPKAITSEGVSPSPEPADEVDLLFPAAPEDDSQVSTEGSPLRVLVAEGELGGVAAGTPIDTLTLGQLRTLAKVRGIRLGTRKDKKAEIVQALADGK